MAINPKEVGATRRSKDALDLSLRTIERVRQRFVEDGMETALQRRPGAGRNAK
ncbi:MAG: hypothetical protein HC895_27125 [Leptolyngbyaceae cyanobacterium SM1_3_5]|nr:hypothetical protein [Leptolyngbyaceae cyanobacterium SM1_3_5]